jgi:UDP-N-acetylglucosamine 2-epimerase
MFDALMHFSKISEKKSKILENLAVESKEYYLATVHRAENTDDPHRIKNILIALAQLDRIVVFPIHPRTKKRIEEFNFKQLLSSANILSIDPVGYLDMICLEKNAKAIITDSGGVQKEAFWLGVPCITLRDETEWLETVSSGCNKLVKCEPDKIIDAIRASFNSIKPGDPLDFGFKLSSSKIVEIFKLLENR